MPNGHDKNWVRLLGAIGGFRWKYRRWPRRVRMFPGALHNIQRDLFTPEAFAKLTEKIELIPEEGAPMVAEDDEGNSYSYGAEGFAPPDIHPRDWLGVEPDLPE